VSDKPDAADVEQERKNLEFILDIPLQVTVELGRTKLLVKDIRSLTRAPWLN